MVTSEINGGSGTCPHCNEFHSNVAFHSAWHCKNNPDVKSMKEFVDSKKSVLYDIDMNDLTPDDIVESAFNLIADLKNKEKCYLKLLDFREEIRSIIKYGSKPPLQSNEDFEEYVYRRLWECTSVVED